MNVRFFEIDTSGLPATAAPPAPQIFPVKGLNAYAISSAVLSYNGQANRVGHEPFFITGTDLVCNTSLFVASDVLELVVYHYGIRDYSLLFPLVSAFDDERAARLGRFYQEAENAFNTEAWLSFMLMSAAIFEHLLYFNLGSPAGMTTLYDLSQEARRRDVISAAELTVVDSTRRSRNVIHCNKMNEVYISRSEALDARALIERLILKVG